MRKLRKLNNSQLPPANIKQKKHLSRKERRRLEEEYAKAAELCEISEQPLQDILNTKPKHRFLRKFVVVILLLCVIVIIVNLGILLFTGQIWFNEPKKRDYPVRGPVVNQDLGTVNWSKFSQQNIQMAYIRATKSTTFVDSSFEENWEKSKKTDLPVGALHIFDYAMDGKKQAEHFCETIGSDIKGRLLPAVEVDLNGFYFLFAPSKDKAVDNIKEFLDYVENQYGVKPVIKCADRVFKKYIRDYFSDYPLWYESLYSEPDESINWTFWGYTKRTRISFYKNSDKYVYMTVFSSDENSFKNLYI